MQQIGNVLPKIYSIDLLPVKRKEVIQGYIDGKQVSLFKDDGRQVPQFIQKYDELLQKYEKTNLDWRLYLRIIAELEAKNMIKIPEVTMIEWFKEFVNAKWTNEKLLTRFDGVKNAQLFGGVITLNHWFREDLLYTDAEVNKRVEEVIATKAREAEQLKALGLELSPDALKYIRFSAYQKFVNDSKIERGEKIERMVEEQAKEFKRTKRKKIAVLSKEEKAELFQRLVNDGIISVKSELEGKALLENLQLLADIIPDKYLRPENA